VKGLRALTLRESRAGRGERTLQQLLLLAADGGGGGDAVAMATLQRRHTDTT